MLTFSAGYRELLQSLDQWFENARAASAPGTIPCTRGCTACCYGPFDISPADAALVVEAVDRLTPILATGMRQRASEHRAHVRAKFDTWRAPWDVESISEEVFDAVCEYFAELPCPALDAEGSCLIHDSRPATCRITGLAMLLPSGEVLENVCPIQTDFPSYQALAPVPFDLLSFESEAEWWDALARSDGRRTTTVAGALG